LLECWVGENVVKNMGYFTYAYIVDGQLAKSGVDFTISAYRAGDTAYFSWGAGDRPGNMTAFASGTLFCDREMRLLPGYPRVERRKKSDFKESRFLLLEESFFPRNEHEPVLFHVVLPPGYIIRRDREPFTLTKSANVAVIGDRLVVTLPSKGNVDLRFWMAPLAEGETFDDFELNKFLSVPQKDPLKVGFEINLGVFKVKFG
jgi:hypothetical protein